MSIATFDKLAYSEALKAGGFTHEQATTQANALDTALKDTVATQHDIELLRRDLTLRCGSMLVAAVGIIIAAIKLL